MRILIQLTLCATFWIPTQIIADERISVSIDGKAFSLLSGFDLEKAVPDALIKWPVVVDWDNAGRLVVVESGGVSRPIEEHNKKLLHQIVRLEDTDNDGTFDKRVLASDKLPFVEGVLCLGENILA